MARKETVARGGLCVNIYKSLSWWEYELNPLG